MREALLYSSELHIDLRSSNENSELQIRQIDSMLNEGIDLLVVAPTEAKNSLLWLKRRTTGAYRW